ncbi:restriction endonuclease subunit S [Streptomyces sp. NPDC005930]|uniref:restriction endonuclease subunit S n=1 Tax=Streptomyces sp. NPDC005930 TaxID=3364736 RepID=UPI0036CB6237
MSNPSELPEGWAWATLAEVVDVLDHLRTPVSAKERAARYGTVPYYGAAGQVGWIDEKIFDEELVLLGEDGVQFFDADKVKAYLIAGPSWVNNHAHVLRALDDCIDRRYLTYYLNHFNYEGFANGTTRLKLTKSAMLKIPVKLPPLEEQRRIVAELEEQSSRLDAAEGYAAKVRKKLLTYQASRELELVPAPDGDTARNALPEGWRMVQLSDISYSSGYGTSAKCSYVGRGDGVLRIPNIQGGSIDAADLKYALDADLDLTSYRVRAGDLLVVRTNGSRDLIGRVAVSRDNTEYAFASYLIRFRINTQEASPDWVAKVLSTRPWRRLIESAAASTAGQYNLNLKKLGSLPIPLPPLEQQSSLTAVLNEIGESVRILTDAVGDASVKGGALRRSLLIEAFTGRLVPQDPADEPADELLRRVRADREAAGVAKTRRRGPRRAQAQRKPVPDAPQSAKGTAPALAAATQPTLDLEISS